MSETPTILKVTQRDVRVTVGGLRPARRISSPVRAGAFAQRILGCYAGRRGRWPLLAQVFRQSQPGVTWQAVHYHTHAHLAPRLELTVLGRSAWAPDAPTVERFTPGLRLKRPTQTPVLALTSARLAAQVVEQVTQRLIVRAERSEVGPALTRVNTRQDRSLPLKPDSSARISIPPVPPVRRIVRRSSAVEAAPAAVARPAAGAHAALPDEFKRPASGSQMSDAAIDVNRLTEQVIRAIDQRIIAQRERLGRI